jgi:hypothetical protein
MKTLEDIPPTLRITYPAAKSRLLIMHGEFTIDFTHQRPIFWWRVWYWLLLGWKWKAIR